MAALPRREMLGAVVLSAAAVLTPRAASAAAGDAERDQWKRAVADIDKLATNYESISAKGGDEVRKYLGTVGDSTLSSATTPMFKIDKSLKKLASDADDPEEFLNAVEEFLLRVSAADSMAYSANFAGGSGKPKPPAEYLRLAGEEVKDMRKRADEVTEALGSS